MIEEGGSNFIIAILKFALLYNTLFFITSVLSVLNRDFHTSPVSTGDFNLWIYMLITFLKYIWMVFEIAVVLCLTNRGTALLNTKSYGKI
jgi:hypothetical protein